MIIPDLHLIVGIISSLAYKCFSFQDSAPPQRFPTGFLLPTVRNKVDDVPTVPTAPPTTAKTTTSTTTTKKTTTTTFELTPLSTEPTTPRVYVSTSNFRPTLPNFGQEEEEEEEEQSSEEEEQEEVVEEPERLETDVKVPRVPLVLAPQSSTTTSKTTSKTTSTPSSSTTSSSSTSESSFNIHNRLDELASNLDPWAHIQQAAKKVRSDITISSLLCLLSLSDGG